MIKKSLFALLAAIFLLSNAVVAHAQKIYLLAEGDIRDAKIGRAVDIDLEIIRQLFRGSLPNNRLVIYNEDYSWSGPRISDSSNAKDAILTAIRKCPAGSSDTIVFYWSGHGAYDRGGHYLLMPMRSGTMYRSDILSALQNKGASLTVLLTDSCNVFHQYRQEVNPGAGAPPSGIPPVFQSLFFNCRGVVNVNSSSPGEVSYCHDRLGSVFTNNFGIAVSENYDNYVSWSKVLGDTQNLIQRSGYRQHYYYWGTLPSSGSSGSRRSGYSGPNRSTPNPPSPPEPLRGQWSAPSYHPESGDRIIYVNDIAIRNEEHFRQVIRNSDTRVKLTLIGHRSGKRYYMVTDLNAPNSTSRLGIYVQDDSRGGVMVTRVMPGSPGTRCRYLMDGIQSVRSNENVY